MLTLITAYSPSSSSLVSRHRNLCERTSWSLCKTELYIFLMSPKAAKTPQKTLHNLGSTAQIGSRTLGLSAEDHYNSETSDYCSKSCRCCDRVWIGCKLVRTIHAGRPQTTLLLPVRPSILVPWPAASLSQECGLNCTAVALQLSWIFHPGVRVRRPFIITLSKVQVKLSSTSPNIHRNIQTCTRGRQDSIT